MRKIAIFIIIIVGVTSFYSCKKCKTCECWKNGEIYNEENCSYELLSSKSTFDTWERYLKEEMGYDSVKCVME